MSISFSWDKRKASANVSKHGVTFDEAKTVFYDPDARLRPDDEHSQSEDRFVILGRSEALRLLIVCHCYRDDDEVIRIISARKANAEERKQYERFKRG